MQRYRTHQPASALPAEVLAGSAVARRLWTARGTRDGITLAQLCADLRRSERAVYAQLCALDSALERLESPWWLLHWSEADEITGEWQAHWLLIGPGCPRPPAREPAGWSEPEIISIEDLEEHL